MTERLASRAPRLLALCACVALVGSAHRTAASPSAQVSGSVFVDDWIVPDQAVRQRAPTGIVPEAAVKIGVDITDELSFSVKLCASCHGVEFEHINLDWMPSEYFNVQVGRMAIPFGEYASRIDPSGHKTSDAPLIFDMGRMAYGERSAMNLGVVPLPYVDSGVMIYGQAFPLPKLKAWYGGYVTMGMRGANDLDWIAMRSSPYRDNNGVPAVGGRLALSLITEPGATLKDLGVGASITGGRYDPNAQLGYLAWGVNAMTRVWILTLRGEYAYRRTDLDPTQSYAYALVDGWFQKDGWYAELEHPVTGWLSAVYRADQLRRNGAQLPGSQANLSTASRITRYTGGLMLVPASALFAKVSYEYWQSKDFPSFSSVHVGFGGAF